MKKGVALCGDTLLCILPIKHPGRGACMCAVYKCSLTVEFFVDIGVIEWYSCFINSCQGRKKEKIL